MFLIHFSMAKHKSCNRFAALWLIASPMAPKVKTTIPLESMATQPDSPAEKPPEEELETQCTPEPVALPDALPKRKRGRPKGGPSASNTTKTRPTQAPLVKNVISKNLLVHPKIVQQVLNEFENVCVERIKTKGVFRTRFFTVKHREALRGARCTLEFVPGKNWRQQLCK